MTPPPGEPFADRAGRALAAVRAIGADALLASDAATVRWLTGRSADIEHGRGSWTVGTHVLLEPGGAVIICPEEEQTRGERVAGHVVLSYEAFTLGAELVPEAWAASVLTEALALAGLDDSDHVKIAIEQACLPAGLLRSLGDRTTVSADVELRAARAIKDASELALIERAAELTTAGQQRFRDRLAIGVSEIELFSEVHGAMEKVAGERVPVLADLMFGERCLQIGLPPTDRALRADELAMCDLVVRRDGYWCDSCVTLCSTAPSTGARRIHDAAMSALEVGIRQARPGVTAGQLDSFVRERMAHAGYDYDLHTGHGVGASGHEEPRIVPGATLMLEEDMVIALEPGAYVDPDGVRVEHVIVVTPEGGRVLTGHSLDIG